MGTTTTRLGLYKPATTDYVSVVTDLNNNMDILDTAVGTIACTSSTRPVAPIRVTGTVIYETDTGRTYIYSGSAWLQLLVDGATAGDGTINLASNTAVAGTLSTTGDVTFTGDLDVSGKLTGKNMVKFLSSSPSPVNNSTTYVAITNLTITLAANKLYSIVTNFGFTGPAAGGVKVLWGTSGGVAQWSLRAVHAAAPGSTDVLNATNVYMGRKNLNAGSVMAVETTDEMAHVEHFVVETTTAGTSGTLYPQFAQSTATVGNLNILPGSYIIATEVEVV